jgi:membrane complex biogenesis BtpA family protein
MRGGLLVMAARKTVVAMAHFPPLPGAPGYDRDGGIAKLRDLVARDVEALQDGGVDAIMFGNEGDRPYRLAAQTESLAAMASVIGELKALLKVPFGVNYLWDPVATVALACATGATFAREIFTGVYASDMGLWTPDGAGALRLRDQLGRPDLKLMFNINAEFATSLDTRPLPERARSAVFSSCADILCVSGPMTGEGVATTDLEAVKKAVTVPVFANTGVRLSTVAEILRIADGCVVGTWLKVDGITWNPVDPVRVRQLMDRVASLR